MSGIAITRDTAMRVLAEVERELRAEIAKQASTIPAGKGSCAIWSFRHEERLRTLDALRILVFHLPHNAVLLGEEQ